MTEANSSGGWYRGYVYGAGGEMLGIQANGAVTWAYQDAATKSQRLADSSGAVTAAVDLDPWGLETGRSWNSSQQRHKYTTYERDGNQSDDAVMRRHNRWHMRFDQPDPYEGSYDLTDPQSLNRYAYVSNDPVNFTDPTGLVKAAPRADASLGWSYFSDGFWGYPSGSLRMKLIGHWMKASVNDPREWEGWWGALFTWEPWGGFFGGQGWGGGRKTESKSCDPNFFAEGETFSDTHGNEYQGSDLNDFGRLVYAESGNNDEERAAVASVIQNRLLDGPFTSFNSLGKSGQFEAVTGGDTRAYDRTAPSVAGKLGEADCNSLRAALDTVRSLLSQGARYPQFRAFRGGKAPFRSGEMTIIGNSRFAASDYYFIPPSKRKR